MAVTVVKLCPTRDLLAYGTDDGHVRIEKITRPMVSFYSPCNFYITLVLRYVTIGGGEFPLNSKMCVHCLCSTTQFVPANVCFCSPPPPLASLKPRLLMSSLLVGQQMEGAGERQTIC